KMTIGRVAAAAGVSVETIRYYQRRGLLEEPAKPIGGYRLYPAEMVNRICFIKRAQVLGFTLGDVAGLLRLDNREACATTRELAAQKVALTTVSAVRLFRSQTGMCLTRLSSLL